MTSAWNIIGKSAIIVLQPTNICSFIDVKNIIKNIRRIFRLKYTHTNALEIVQIMSSILVISNHSLVGSKLDY